MPGTIGHTAGDCETAAPSPSWERRDELGITSAFCATVKELYFRPRSVFSASHGSDEARDALLYGTIAGSLGILGLLLGGFLFSSWIVLRYERRPLVDLYDMALDYGFAYLSILTPIIVYLSVYSSAFFVHGVIKILGSDLHFSHTLRVHSYVAGNAILLMALSAPFPFAGTIFALVDYATYTPPPPNPLIIFLTMIPELDSLIFGGWNRGLDNYWPALGYFFSLMYPLLAGGFYLVSVGTVLQSTVHQVRSTRTISICYFFIFLCYFALGALTFIYYLTVNGRGPKLPKLIRRWLQQ